MIKSINKLLNKMKKKLLKKDVRDIDGQNNIVEVANSRRRLKIRIYGDNNQVIVKTNEFFKADIQIGLPDVRVHNCKVLIEEAVTSNGFKTLILEDGFKLTIGEDSMFSSEIYIHSSDTHTVIDENGNVTNIGKEIEIGKHCWIGKGVTILKNTKISDNSIVGTQAVVAKKFEKPNCAIAGNPAKVIKENINWSRLRPKQYMEQQNIK